MTDTKKPAILGVDLYRGDMGGKPNWGAFAALGAPWHFAIIKATQGTAYPLDWLIENAQKMKRAFMETQRYGTSLWRGFYHYVDFWKSGKTQAEFYLKAIEQAGGWDHGDLWPIIDVERGNDGKDGKPVAHNYRATADQVEDVSTLCAETIKLETGRDVMLYGRGAMLDLDITSHMGCTYLWEARYNDKIYKSDWEMIGWHALDIWQYAEDGNAHPNGLPASPPKSFGIDCQVSVVTNPLGLEWFQRYTWAESPGQTAPVILKKES